MSQNDYQGKKPNQIKDSEMFALTGLVLFIITIIILILL